MDARWAGFLLLALLLGMGFAAVSLYISSLIYVGLVLFFITIIVNILAQILIWRVSKGHLDEHMFSR